MGIQGPALCLITATHAPDPLYPGQGIRLTATITNLGSPISPGNVQVYTLDPNAGETTFPTPTKDATGSYHQDFVLNSTAAIGTWLVKWVTTDGGLGLANNFAVTVDSFDVAALPF